MLVLVCKIFVTTGQIRSIEIKLTLLATNPNVVIVGANFAWFKKDIPGKTKCI